MTDTSQRTDVTRSSTSVLHPLEPLSPEEITAAVSIVRTTRNLSDKVSFVSVTLHEPPRESVRAFKPGNPITRKAFLILLDKSGEIGATYEAIVNLTSGEIVSWHHIPEVEPSILLSEFFACEEAVKSHPDFQAALAKRGITNLDLVYVDPWTAGYYGLEGEHGRRLLRTTVHMRLDPNDPNENSYAHPVEGLHALVDLTTMQVVQVVDYGIIPVPPTSGNYTADAVGPLRTDVKPITITQPEGPSFTVEGHEVRWQKWSIRLGFTPREGLVLYDVRYEDQGRQRPILYRAALAEMVVPYGDTSPSHRLQNAFDVGEYGVGWLANALELGCDCLGHIRYFDAHMTDTEGNVLTLPNVVCMHEEDVGIGWKHTNFRTGHVEVRRSRRLVLSFISTVGIYEYGFFWYFYQDGSIEHEIKLTGIMNTAAIPPGEKSKYGALVAPQLYAPIHQHFFSVRLDMTVDGAQNSVYEVNTEVEPRGPGNSYGNAFYTQDTLLSTETEAQRAINPQSARYWKVVNTDVLNNLGEPVGYKLMSKDNVLLFADAESSIAKRAAFATKHLWVTPYDPAERYPAGDYPNQHSGGAGLPAWTEANRDIVQKELVLWYTVGVHHVPRPEDWPVMPVTTAGFMLRPVGFFERNPALDVPPPSSAHDTCCEIEGD